VVAVEGEGRWKIGEGSRPLWSFDGSELLFRRPGELLRVPIEMIGGTIRPGRIATLLSGPFPLERERSWAVHPDGKRFLMPCLQADDTDSGQQLLTVILNWDPVGHGQ